LNGQIGHAEATNHSNREATKLEAVRLRGETKYECTTKDVARKLHPIAWINPSNIKEWNGFCGACVGRDARFEIQNSASNRVKTVELKEGTDSGTRCTRI
jgi:hypothetical protein